MIRIKIQINRLKVRNNNNLAISSQQKMITMMMTRNKTRNRKRKTNKTLKTSLNKTTNKIKKT